MNEEAFGEADAEVEAWRVRMDSRCHRIGAVNERTVIWTDAAIVWGTSSMDLNLDRDYYSSFD